MSTTSEPLLRRRRAIELTALVPRGGGIRRVDGDHTSLTALPAEAGAAMYREKADSRA